MPTGTDTCRQRRLRRCAAYWYWLVRFGLVGTEWSSTIMALYLTWQREEQRHSIEPIHTAHLELKSCDQSSCESCQKHLINRYFRSVRQFFSRITDAFRIPSSKPGPTLCSHLREDNMGASLAVTNPNEAGSISVGANLVAGVSTSLLNETGRVGPHDMFHDMSFCVTVNTVVGT